MPFDRCLNEYDVIRLPVRDSDRVTVFPDRGEPMGLLLALTYSNYRGPQPRGR